MPKGIPSATVSRLVTYLRVLSDLDEAGQTRTSSDSLAAEAQVTAFQVRKDLAYFGSFGTRGSGYSVHGLRQELRRILGLTRPWRVAIVGMGRLGQALADFPQLGEYDFELVTAFDVDPDKVGRRLGGVEVRHSDDMPRLARQLKLDIAFLTVPVPAAQAATDAVVEAGIVGILNFVPTVLSTPPGVWVETADFLVALKRLAYFLQGQGPAAGTAAPGAAAPVPADAGSSDAQPSLARTAEVEPTDAGSTGPGSAVAEPGVDVGA